MVQAVEQIISAKWVIPVDGAQQVLKHHSIVINAGKIVDILPTNDLNSQYTTKQAIELNDHALIPGLINAHTHASMNLLRGYADDLALMDWLQNHIWPAEARWVGAEFVYEGTQLAIAESIRGGVTCLNEMYFFPDEAARAFTESGMRATVGLIVLDFPTVWASNADEYLQKALLLHDKLKHNSRIRTAFAPHAPYTVSDAPLAKIVSYAEELDVPIHMHVHETEFEVAQALEKNGKSELHRLQDLGLVSPRLLAVHMTQLNDNEIALCASNGVHVVHCPESNMKLSSGVCPVPGLLREGVNVCLGTDGSASNNDLDMFGEMRSAALLAKVNSGDPTVVNAYQALQMATINGARALGIDDVTGSLSVGKSADIVAINMNDINSLPVYNPVSQIVYSVSRNQVSHVWVEGQCLLNAGKLTTLDEKHLINIAKKWNAKLQETESV